MTRTAASIAPGIPGLHLRLREPRDRARETKTDAAYKAGISYSTLRTYEEGRTTPHLNMLYRLADIYGTTVAELLGEPHVAA